MKTRIWRLTTALAALSVASLAGSAWAQPHRDDRRDDRDDHRHDRDRDRDRHIPPAAGSVAMAPPAAGTVAVAPPAAGGVAEAPPANGAAVAPAATDPHLAARLQQLEDQRQRGRRAGAKDQKSWHESRPQRASQHKSEVAGTWGNTVNAPDAQSELKLHADRMARLNRILDLANQKGDTALAARAQADIQTEVNRDATAMQAISAKAGTQ